MIVHVSHIFLVYSDVLHFFYLVVGVGLKMVNYQRMSHVLCPSHILSCGKLNYRGQ